MRHTRAIQAMKALLGHFAGRQPNAWEKGDHESLYRYTSGRWLFNESTHLARRRVEFNAPALGRIAAQAVGAKECTSLKKLTEGMFNKILLLNFDNGTEAVARIPCPLSGPPHLVTASEVATLEFARTVLGLPAPKVFAWSSRAAETDIGAEFILMEKVAGIEMAEMVNNDAIHVHAHPHVTKQVVEIERRFGSIPFSHIGSIFFKGTIAPEQEAPTLYAETFPEDDESRIYTIGPLMQWDLWRGERSTNIHNKGPWPDMLSFITSIVKAEQEWLKQHAKPRAVDDPFCFYAENNDPAAHVAVLDQVLSVLPFILPDPIIQRPVLWHIDLHPSNILISESPPHDIVGILDWQNMGVGPLCTQGVFAKCMIYTGNRVSLEGVKTTPSRPAGYDDMPPDEQRLVRQEQVLAMRQKYYEHVVKKEDPLHLAALSYPHIDIVIQLIYSVNVTWEDGLHKVRHLLYRLHENWSDIAPPDTPCPMHFTPEEAQRHLEDYKRMEMYEARVKAVQMQLGVSPDGHVDNDRYEIVKKLSDELKDQWDPVNAGGPYPFQDGATSITV